MLGCVRSSVLILECGFIWCVRNVNYNFTTIFFRVDYDACDKSVVDRISYGRDDSISFAAPATYIYDEVCYFCKL